jgi:hypothetical protein
MKNLLTKDKADFNIMFKKLNFSISTEKNLIKTDYQMN